MSDLWLIEESTLESLQALEDRMETPSAEQIQAFNAGFSDGAAPRNYEVSGNVATVGVSGILTDRPSFLAMLMGRGNTTYSDIRKSIALAERDSTVERIKLRIDSPGGTAATEWEETINAVAATTKPVTAEVGNLAASAAYGIASQADEIRATNNLSRVGSIGVLIRMKKPSKDAKMAITSSNAPDKEPNPETEQGQSVVRRELDAMERIFIDHVATGRGVSADTVRNEYGRGAVLLAEQALDKGMIDSIGGADAADKEPTAALSGVNNNEETRSMDLTTLKAEHPAVYAQAVTEGVTQERERAEAHIVLGESCGDMSIAVAAIKDGSELSAKLQAQYMAASMNRNDVKARAEADKETAEALGGKATTKTVVQTDEDEVLAMMEDSIGIRGDA